MKAYISVGYNIRKEMTWAITAMAEVLTEFKIEPFVFIDHYAFAATQEQQMMEQAMTDINECDFLIAETSEKAIGVGIEVGYAKAKSKPVIYVRHAEADHSTTVSGISEFQIIYRDQADLKAQLHDAIINILKKVSV